MNDEDLLLNEICRNGTSLDGKIDEDQLRRSFAYALRRQDPRRRGSHAAYTAAIDRARDNGQLWRDPDGALRLPPS